MLGCQSRLRTVERMGFLMCLHTHLDTHTHVEGRGTGHLSTQGLSSPGTPRYHGTLQTTTPPARIPGGRGLGTTGPRASWLDQARGVLGPLQLGTLSLVAFKPHDKPGPGSAT